MCSSNDLEDNVFDHVTPNTPKRFDEFLQRDVFFHQNRASRGSADYEISRKFMKPGITPDTPISQVKWKKITLTEKNLFTCWAISDEHRLVSPTASGISSWSIRAEHCAGLAEPQVRMLRLFYFCHDFSCLQLLSFFFDCTAMETFTKLFLSPLFVLKSLLSACKTNSATTIKSKIPEIPPFRGKTKMSKQNLQNWIRFVLFPFFLLFVLVHETWSEFSIDKYWHKSQLSSSSCATTSSSSAPSAKGSPSVQIPDIPAFKKTENQHSNYSPYKAVTQSTTSTSISVSPPAVSNVTQFRKRSSKEIVQIEHDHKSPSGGAEWKHRLQVAELSPIHRSTECISSKNSDSKFIKPAPSLTNISMKIEQCGTSNGYDTRRWAFCMDYPLFRSNLRFHAENVDRRRTTSGGNRSQEESPEAKVRQRSKINRRFLVETKRAASKGSRESRSREGGRRSWRTG